jgi:hypothetical protein
MHAGPHLEANGAAERTELHGQHDEGREEEHDEAGDTRLVAPQVGYVPAGAPAKQVPERVPDDLDADDGTREGVQMMHVVEGQPHGHVRAEEHAAQVVALGQEQQHVQRIVEVRAASCERQEHHLTPSRGANGGARAQAEGPGGLRARARFAVGAGVDAERRRSEDGQQAHAQRKDAHGQHARNCGGEERVSLMRRGGPTLVSSRSPVFLCLLAAGADRLQQQRVRSNSGGCDRGDPRITRILCRPPDVWGEVEDDRSRINRVIPSPWGSW